MTLVSDQTGIPTVLPTSDFTSGFTLL